MRPTSAVLRSFTRLAGRGGGLSSTGEPLHTFLRARGNSRDDRARLWLGSAVAALFCLASSCRIGLNLEPLRYRDAGPDAAPSPPNPVPETSEVSISSVGSHACTVRTDGQLRCWAGIDAGTDKQAMKLLAASPPAGEYAHVSAGFMHTCALRLDGSAICWGYDVQGQTAAPSATFESISAGSYHTCGVVEDHTVSCWGAGTDPDAGALGNCGQALPPADRFRSVSSGHEATCGITVDGGTLCWGCGTAAAPPSDVAFDQISVGYATACGVTTDHSLRCWGLDVPDLPTGRFQSVSGTCALREDATAVCWGDLAAQTPSNLQFVQLSAGPYACGVSVDHVMQCWGSKFAAEPPGSAP